MFQDTMYSTVQDKLFDKASRFQIPLSVSFELTYRCNLKCIHCYIVQQLHQEELSTAEIMGILEQLKKSGCFFITFTGGEVLLREDLLDICKYARKLGFSLTLFTNGTLITEVTADKLKEFYFQEIDLSVYGVTSHVHDRITRTPGSFDKTISAIRMLTQRGIRLRIKTTLMRENFEQRGMFDSFYKKWGTLGNLSVLIVPQNDGSREPLLHRLTDEEAKVYLSECIHKGVLEGRFDPDAYYKNLTSKMHPPLQRIRPCGSGVRNCHINPSGEVFPCIQLLISAGNVRNISFIDIWKNSSILKRMRKIRFSNLYKCRDCEYLLNTSYRCIGLSWLEDGDLLGASRECCRLTHLEKEAMEGYKKLYKATNTVRHSL